MTGVPEHLDIAHPGDHDRGVAGPGGDPVRPGVEEAAEVPERIPRVQIRTAGARDPFRQSPQRQGQRHRADRHQNERHQADRTVDRQRRGQREHAGADHRPDHQSGRRREPESVRRARVHSGRHGRRRSIVPDRHGSRRRTAAAAGVPTVAPFHDAMPPPGGTASRRGPPCRALGCWAARPGPISRWRHPAPASGQRVRAANARPRSLLSRMRTRMSSVRVQRLISCSRCRAWVMDRRQPARSATTRMPTGDQ